MTILTKKTDFDKRDQEKRAKISLSNLKYLLNDPIAASLLPIFASIHHNPKKFNTFSQNSISKKIKELLKDTPLERKAHPKSIRKRLPELTNLFGIKRKLFTAKMAKPEKIERGIPIADLNTGPLWERLQTAIHVGREVLANLQRVEKLSPKQKKTPKNPFHVSRAPRLLISEDKENYEKLIVIPSEETDPLSIMFDNPKYPDNPSLPGQKKIMTPYVYEFRARQGDWFLLKELKIFKGHKCNPRGQDVKRFALVNRLEIIKNIDSVLEKLENGGLPNLNSIFRKADRKFKELKEKLSKGYWSDLSDMYKRKEWESLGMPPSDFIKLLFKKFGVLKDRCKNGYVCSTDPTLRCYPPPPTIADALRILKHRYTRKA